MSGRWIVIGSMFALAYLAEASVASAGPPQERHGFWIGLGGGAGSARATCDGCDSDERKTAGVAYLKMGGTLNEHLLLGGEFNFWSKGQEGTTLNLYNVSATLTVYPQPSSGFFLKGGGGLAVVDRDFREGSRTVTVDLGTGPGMLLGAGYDVRVGRRISITPAVNFWLGWSGDVTLEGDVLTNSKHNVVDLTVGVTFH